jgi:hypothetical protein
MLALRQIAVSLAAFALITVVPARPAHAQSDAARARSRLIVMADLKAAPGGFDQSITLLELVRKQLPLVVQSGRFDTDAGVVSVCVYARRSARGSDDAGAGGSLPRCPMIAAFVDDVRVSHTVSLLETTRALDLESVELVRAGEAGWRFGMAADGAEALVIWTRGRGPHARPRL